MFIFSATIGFIILIITKIINISIEEETFIIRKLQFITGYFVTFPIIIICSVFAIKVVIYYVSINKILKNVEPKIPDLQRLSVSEFFTLFKHYGEEGRNAYC